ncbi:MAG: (Fe-S)-binding protein [Candidatus Riflebacteria bacterium]|nr:(Fe-S)-binding protein [Candidatus Riflebacteria bacterium]
MRLRKREELVEWVDRQISNCVKCGACHASCPVFRVKKSEISGMRGKMALLQALSSSKDSILKPLSDDIANNFSDCFSCSNCRSACVNKVETLFISDLIKPYLFAEEYAKIESALNFRNSAEAVRSELGGNAVFFVGTMQGESSAANAIRKENIKSVMNFLKQETVFLDDHFELSAASRFEGDLSTRISWVVQFLLKAAKVPASEILIMNPDILYLIKLTEILIDFNESEIEALKKIIHVSAFLERFEFNFSKKIDGKYAYFDSCLALSGVFNCAASKKILNKVLAEKITEIPQEGLCCGGKLKNGNAQSVEMYDKNRDYFRAKLQKFGITNLVTDNLYCLENMSELFREAKIKVFSSIELLAPGIKC